ncbi:MAG TPA: hypothetical protein VFV99_02870 [Kofleriaceae bacterium]|nr:hypothetical protein [Kofleriaceae bacterium]
MKPRRALRVPVALVFTVGTAAAVVASAASVSCGGDDDTKKDGGSCGVFCFASQNDGGVPPPDGGCPLCADFSSGTPVCPAGCDPLG